MPIGARKRAIAPAPSSLPATARTPATVVMSPAALILRTTLSSRSVQNRSPPGAIASPPTEFTWMPVPSLLPAGVTTDICPEDVMRLIAPDAGGQGPSRQSRGYSHCATKTSPPGATAMALSGRPWDAKEVTWPCNVTVRIVRGLRSTTRMFPTAFIAMSPRAPKRAWEPEPSAAAQLTLPASIVTTPDVETAPITALRSSAKYSTPEGDIATAITNGKVLKPPEQSALPTTMVVTDPEGEIFRMT